MGLCRRIVWGLMSILLVSVSVFAQSIQSTSAISEGKYENEPVVRRDGAGRQRQSAASQPVTELPSNTQLKPWRVGLALAIVIGMILAMRWAGNRFFPSAGVPRSGGAMKVLSRLVLSPKQQLLMIQIGRRIVVVGDSAGQMSAISQITDGDEVSTLMLQLADEKSQSSSKMFGTLFQRAEKAFDEKNIDRLPVEPRAQVEAEPSPAASEEQSDSAVVEARGEINELADKIRMLSAQFGKTVGKS